MYDNLCGVHFSMERNIEFHVAERRANVKSDKTCCKQVGAFKDKTIDYNLEK